VHGHQHHHARFDCVASDGRSAVIEVGVFEVLEERE
jgi:hypothetical protein